MYCTSCGKKVEEGFAFCDQCGAKIIYPVPNAQSNQAAQPQVNQAAQPQVNQAAQPQVNQAPQPQSYSYGAGQQMASQQPQQNQFAQRQAQPYKAPVQPKKKSSAGTVILIILLVLFMLGVLIIGGCIIGIKYFMKKADINGYIENGLNSIVGEEIDGLFDTPDDDDNFYFGDDSDPGDMSDPGDTYIPMNSITVGRPDFSEFDWLNEAMEYDVLPSDAIELTSFEDIKGDWKCEFFYDPFNERDNQAVEILNLKIEGSASDATATADWYMISIPNSDIYNEEDMEDSIFYCTMDESDGSLSGSGPGSLYIIAFYELDGKQYGLGALIPQDGTTTIVGLVRP